MFSVQLQNVVNATPLIFWPLFIIIVLNTFWLRRHVKRMEMHLKEEIADLKRANRLLLGEIQQMRTDAAFVANQIREQRDKE